MLQQGGALILRPQMASRRWRKLVENPGSGGNLVREKHNGGSVRMREWRWRDAKTVSS